MDPDLFQQESSQVRSSASHQRNQQKRYARRVFGPVSAGDENIVITLQIASLLRGRVLDAKGIPVANAYLIAKTKRPGQESTILHASHAEVELRLPVPVNERLSP